MSAVGRHGTILYPSGEVYVGQWDAETIPASLTHHSQQQHVSSGISGQNGAAQHAGNRCDVGGLTTPSSSVADSDASDDDIRLDAAKGRHSKAGGRTVHADGPAPLRDGWGVHLAAHEKYEGEWRGDLEHGLGCGNKGLGGDRYIGQFEHGSRKGAGVTISKLGVLHVVNWDGLQLKSKKPLFRSASDSHSARIWNCSNTPGSFDDDLASFGPNERAPNWLTNECPSSSSSGGSEASSSRSASPSSAAKNGLESPVRDGDSSATFTPLPQTDQEEADRSNLKAMNTWSPREVARLIRCLGLGASLAAKLRAHYVGGAALRTLASQSAAPFLKMLFEEDEIDGICNGHRLLVVAVELFLKLRHKLLAHQVSAATLGEQFRDVEIKEGQITFDRLVGKGGYGRVYLARWMGADVAVKTSRFTDKDKIARDFYSELSVLRSLRHPNITLLIGFSFQPQCIIVTEFVRSGSLFDLLHRKRENLLHLSGWNCSKVVAIAREICLGMVYLHSHGILHCDLKSSNVLLNGLREVKICDFGLAHLFEDAALQVETSVNLGCVGTHHWMAPEVLRGQEYSTAADVYSFGMILWEMISRKVPFHGYTAIQVIGIVGYGRCRPRSPHGCPEPLRDVLHKVLRPRPHSRCTFPDLCEDFERLHRSAVIDVEERLWTFLTG